MFWVIQHNLWKEEGFNLLVNALHRFNCSYEVVRVVPFSSRLIPVDYDRETEHLEDIPEPDIPADQNIVVCGSVTLARIAKERGWVPGSFLSENHDYSKWKENYGNYLLNPDSKVCRYDQVVIGDEPVFVRPCKDTKAFTGQVFTKEEFESWRTDVLDLKTGHTVLRPETMVAVAPVKEIQREFRFFVVDSNVITGSQYKLGRQIVHNAIVDDDVLAFAQKMVDLWQPSRAFVIDIAMTDHGLKVVENNNLNSAGFYACDVMKVVAAVEAMEY